VLLTKEKVLRQSLWITYVKTSERQGKGKGCKYYSECDNVGGKCALFLLLCIALQMLIGLKT